MTENTKASADQVAAYLRDNPDYFQHLSLIHISEPTRRS
mgnify:CR=1 FL=1